MTFAITLEFLLKKYRFIPSDLKVLSNRLMACPKTRHHLDLTEQRGTRLLLGN